MELSAYETIGIYAKLCKHCSRNTLLQFEDEFTCVMKRKHELSKK